MTKNLYSELFISYNITTWEIQFLEEYYLAYLSLTMIIYCSLIAYNIIYLHLLLKRAINMASILIMITCFSITLNTMLPTTFKYASSNFFFFNDSISKITKIITILISTICLIISQEYVIKNKINNAEYELIIIFAMLGLMTLVIGNDFNTIFLGLELLGLSLYLLTGIKKNTIYCIEGGLKYFLFSSLFGGFYALGWSLLYGTSGMFILLNFQLFFFIFFSDKKNQIVNLSKFNNECDFKIEKNNLDLKDKIVDTNLKLQNLTESIFSFSNKINNDLFLKTKKFEICDFPLLIQNETTFCDICDELFRLLKEENVLTDEIILRAHDKKNNILRAEEYINIDCPFCSNLTKEFTVNDDRRIPGVSKIKEQIYASPYYKQGPCWFCETFRHQYFINLKNDLIKKKITINKAIEVQTNSLTKEQICTEYARLLNDYYGSRHARLTNKDFREIIKKSISETCEIAKSQEIKCPVCHFIMERFINNQENEIIIDFLIKKIFISCRDLDPTNETCRLILLSLYKKIEKPLINKEEKIIKHDLNKLFIIEKQKCNEENKNITHKTKILSTSTFFNNNTDFSTSNLFQKIIIEVSIIFIIIGFFFKLALAPFHLWSLDIYEAAPTSSTIFFATATKISIFIILIKINYLGFYNSLKNYLYQCFIFTSISSVFVGSIGGLAERKLKSLLAYSSITNLGYVIMMVTIGTINSIKAAIFYLIIYINSSLATWSGLISIQKKTNRYNKKQNKDFADILLLKKANPILTILLQIALFSTAGLPPFIGFLTKMNIFLTSMESYMYLISFVTIILGIFSTFYYLRLIKTMCFETVLVGKLYHSMKPEQSNINSILAVFLPYQYIKPWLSILCSYKIVIS